MGGQPFTATGGSRIPTRKVLMPQQLLHSEGEGKKYGSGIENKEGTKPRKRTKNTAKGFSWKKLFHSTLKFVREALRGKKGSPEKIFVG